MAFAIFSLFSHHIAAAISGQPSRLGIQDDIYPFISLLAEIYYFYIDYAELDYFILARQMESR
ncbi:hypothetical protein QJS10_CPB17g01154 [Acorus calamus]|uniref:Uncharacterized protein n=1 Tax=Acorus calamus TaxID=4465 RepID=A0AAV9CSE7_ACOCL|nr:hypothetical protein QJS10_CPB17g01154 [Acorus calamus]